jgi:hypothetical protein
MSAVQDFFKGIRIYDVPYTKVRVGTSPFQPQFSSPVPVVYRLNENDGAYICLDELNRQTSVVYSYGIGDNISFETDFQQRYPQSEILMFDHTINGILSTNPKLRFIKEGITAARESVNAPLNTLDTHMRVYDVVDRPHKILKMDVEWCEWDVFESLPAYVLGRFDQILCEFHTVPVLYKDTHTPYFTEFHKNVYRAVNEELFARYKKILNRILTEFVPYHVHINNSLPLVDVNGYKIPSLVELSLVNRSLVDCDNLVESTASFPIAGLDYPNKPYRADVTDFKWNP